MGQFEEQLGARENLVGFLRWSYIDCWNWRLWGQWQKFPRIIYLWNIDRIRRLPKTWGFRCFRKLQASLDNTSHRAHPLFLGACSTTVWNGGNLQYSTWLKVVHNRIMGRTYIFDLPKNERVIAPKKKNSLKWQCFMSGLEFWPWIFRPPCNLATLFEGAAGRAILDFVSGSGPYLLKRLHY